MPARKPSQTAMVQKMYDELFGNGLVEAMRTNNEETARLARELDIIAHQMSNAPGKCPIGHELRDFVRGVKDEKIANLERQIETESQRAKGRRNFYVGLAAILLTVLSVFGGALWWGLRSNIESSIRLLLTEHVEAWHKTMPD